MLNETLELHKLLLGSPLRLAVFLTLVPKPLRVRTLAGEVGCSERELDAPIAELCAAGVVEDGDGTWSLTADGRRLHRAYVEARSG